jgi:N-acetylmuramoyl-L-alanine amidase
MTKIIVLDPGHGGKDSGAVGLNLKEKDLTLSIVRKIGKLLGEYEGVKVLYTRTDDRFLELAERADLANKAAADYFCSVHINATPSGTGFETYVYTDASSKSVAYQNVIHPEIYKALGKVKDRGKKRANYAVLRHTDMPAILTENLFIDNAADNQLLKQEAFIDKVAQGHVDGFSKAFGLKKKPEPKVEAKPASKTIYRVQVGAYADKKNAEALVAELKKKGYASIIAE